MKKLWQRTMELFRRYPALWLPVFGADLLSYILRHLRPIISNQAMIWILQEHSLLGASSTYDVNNPAKIHAVYLAAGILRFGFELAGVCAYLVAAIITARMLGQMPLQGGPGVSNQRPSIAIYTRSILWLGFMSFLLAMAVGVLISVPSFYYAASLHQNSLMTKPYIASIEVLPAYLIVAYFMVPPLLRLLAWPRNTLIDAETISIGRKFAMVTATIAAAIAIPIGMVKLPLPNTAAETLIANAIGSLIDSVPYIPLFIALSLLAIGAPKEATQTEHDDDGSISPLPAL